MESTTTESIRPFTPRTLTCSRSIAACADTPPARPSQRQATAVTSSRKRRGPMPHARIPRSAREHLGDALQAVQVRDVALQVGDAADRRGLDAIDQRRQYLFLPLRHLPEFSQVGVKS